MTIASSAIDTLTGAVCDRPAFGCKGNVMRDETDRDDNQPHVGAHGEDGNTATIARAMDAAAITAVGINGSRQGRVHGGMTQERKASARTKRDTRRYQDSSPENETGRSYPLLMWRCLIW